MAREPVQAPWVQGLAALLFLLIHHFFRSIDASEPYLWVTGGLAVLGGLSALRGLWAAFRWWRLLRGMTTPSGIFGRTDFPTADDAETLGLSFSNDDGNGIPLGSDGKRIIYWPGKGHMSVRAPTEGGKTESSAALICFALGGHRNIIATAKGAELAILCGQHRESLGQQVIYIDPWGQMRAVGKPSHDFNPIGHLVRYAAQGDPELFEKARAIARILIPEPESGSGENKIFRTQGRDILTSTISYLAIREAETGELCYNLAYANKVLCGAHEELVRFFNEMERCPEFNGAISRAAGKFLAKMQRAGKSAESFLTEAQDALQIYDQASVLGQRTEYSDFDPRDLKNPEKPTSVFIIVPPEKGLTHGSFAGLTLNALADTCIEANSFEPRVTIVADEFASLCEGPLPFTLPTLFLGRSRGVQLITYVQDTESYARYGREASAFTTQSEVILAWGIRSTKDAEEYSKRSGQRGIVAESGNIPAGMNGAADNRFSLGLNEKAVPHMRPDEFLHLPDFTAVLFHKQYPPLIVPLVSYRMVDPWRDQATPVPGAPPLTDVPVRFKA